MWTSSVELAVVDERPSNQERERVLEKWDPDRDLEIDALIHGFARLVP